MDEEKILRVHLLPDATIERAREYSEHALNEYVFALRHLNDLNKSSFKVVGFNHCGFTPGWYLNVILAYNEMTPPFASAVEATRCLDSDMRDLTNLVADILDVGICSEYLPREWSYKGETWGGYACVVARTTATPWPHFKEKVAFQVYFSTRWPDA